jgi:glycosyltransferase involved in cell wall biosynthesis
MKICLVGLDNLPMLVPEYREHPIGGESVQQTLLATALARRGHDVSMVVGDFGQPDGARWSAVRVFKAFDARAGLPVLRFFHPRWTGLWSALARADAELYYTSCAGMHVGLIAWFCRRHRRRFVFRVASDADCEPSRLLVRYARDRRLYALGLTGCAAILVQSAAQADAMARHYGLGSRVAGMLVERAVPSTTRDVDLLWVANMRQLKRPDRLLDVARALPGAGVHMVGGPMPGEQALYSAIGRAALALPNLRLHGRLSYWQTNALCSRARVLLNTSDVEGFPNVYLQAWERGVPVVTLIDPDRVIARVGLGLAVDHPDQLAGAARRLLADASAWQAASARCRAYMDREFDEDRILAPYLETFESVLRTGAPRRTLPAPQARSCQHHG